jgi:hypothetical protein
MHAMIEAWSFEQNEDISGGLHEGEINYLAMRERKSNHREPSYLSLFAARSDGRRFLCGDAAECLKIGARDRP